MKSNLASGCNRETVVDFSPLPEGATSTLTQDQLLTLIELIEDQCRRLGIKDPGRINEVCSLVIEVVWRHFDATKGNLEGFVRTVTKHKHRDLERKERCRPASRGYG